MKKGHIVIALIFMLIIAPTIVYAESFAVLFSGGVNAASNHDRYYEETLRMWGLTTGTLGYEVDNVYVLFGDGTAVGVDRSSGEDSDWSAITGAGGHISSATSGDLQTTLQTVGGLMDGDDSFYFWSFDHGGNSTYTVPGTATEDEGYLCGWGPSYAIPDEVFADWINSYILPQAQQEMYAFGQCFAGDMADDLMDLGGSDHRFTAWAADWYEPSYDKSWVDAWAEGIEAGLTSTHDLGEYALMNDLYGPSGYGWEHPGWTGADLDIRGTMIPEPSTMLLLGAGLIWLAMLGRKKLRK